MKSNDIVCCIASTARICDRYIKQSGPLNVQTLEHGAEECGDSGVAAGAGVASTGEGHRGVSTVCKSFNISAVPARTSSQES